MNIRGVHHVSINVADVAEAGRFYVDVLGMEPLARPDFGVPGLWLQCGGQQIHLIEIAGHEVAKSMLAQHFALRVDDLDVAIETLREKGVDVTNPIELPDVGRQSFLHDPAGNMVELNQPF